MNYHRVIKDRIKADNDRDKIVMDIASRVDDMHSYMWITYVMSAIALALSVIALILVLS